MDVTKTAPLLLNPSFSLHKYSWLMEFLGHIKNYETNTRETVRLALLARKRLFEIAEIEQIDFDLEKRGILHFITIKLIMMSRLRSMISYVVVVWNVMQLPMRKSSRLNLH